MKIEFPKDKPTPKMVAYAQLIHEWVLDGLDNVDFVQMSYQEVSKYIDRYKFWYQTARAQAASARRYSSIS